MVGASFWIRSRLLVQRVRVRTNPACRFHLHRPLHRFKYQLATSVALMRGWLLIAIGLMAFVPSVVMAQGATTPIITAPTSDQILQGQVSINGTTDIPNFLSAELDFAYASDSTSNWFLIQTFSQPIADSTLTTWDTTAITDGDYVLRLRVTLQDGTVQDATVNVKVQNEAPIATATPMPTTTLTPVFTSIPLISTPIIVATSAPTTPPFSTPTALPPNPAEVQTNQIFAGIQRGALVIIGLFIFFGILIRLRRS
jgi:hypothetical protein